MSFNIFFFFKHGININNNFVVLTHVKDIWPLMNVNKDNFKMISKKSIIL